MLIIIENLTAYKILVNLQWKEILAWLPTWCVHVSQYMHYNIDILFIGFPKVLGCVDGTQIIISTPIANEDDFLNRNGVYSLNA